SVKAVEESCVTCGGPHPYYQCLATDGNAFPGYQDNIQAYVSAAAVNYNQGNAGHRPPSVAHQVRPPGFPPVQNNQNRGNNYNPGNSLTELRLHQLKLLRQMNSQIGVKSAYNLGVATPRELVHAGDKTSRDTRSWYMISGDAKSWVVIVLHIFTVILQNCPLFEVCSDKGKCMILEIKDVYLWGFGIKDVYLWGFP
ncbi:hypothetical protein Tco_1001283, partial [Tanacetum coccineum]